MTKEAQLTASLLSWWSTLSPPLQASWRALSKISQVERPANPFKRRRRGDGAAATG
jgi:hypothetical protein